MTQVALPLDAYYTGYGKGQKLSINMGRFGI